MQSEGLNHKRLSSSHSHDNVVRFITVLAADRSPVNSFHSNVTNNPNGNLIISSQFTEVYSDNGTLQVSEVNVSLTTHVLRAVVITDTEENIICWISIHSHPVSGYWPNGAWYTGYRELIESIAQAHAKLPFHIQHHTLEKVLKITSFNSPCLITKDPKQRQKRSTNFLQSFLYCCFLMKVKTTNIICIYSTLWHERNVRHTVLHASVTDRKWNCN